MKIQNLITCIIMMHDQRNHEIWIWASRIDDEPYYHKKQECTQSSLIYISRCIKICIKSNLGHKPFFNIYIWYNQVNIVRVCECLFVRISPHIMIIHRIYSLWLETGKQILSLHLLGCNYSNILLITIEDYRELFRKPWRSIFKVLVINFQIFRRTLSRFQRNLSLKWKEIHVFFFSDR